MKRIDYTRAALAALLIVAAAPALAQDLSPVSDMIDNIIDAVTGPIGRGLGENGGAKLVHGGGGIVLLRAA